MSVALNDIVLWRRLVANIPNLYDYDAVLSAIRMFNLKRKNDHSFVVNVMAMALYELFAADDGSYRVFYYSIV